MRKKSFFLGLICITDFIFCYNTNQGFKQPNYKSHKKDLAQAPSSFFQFLYNVKPKDKFLAICFSGEGFPFFQFLYNLKINFLQIVLTGWAFQLFFFCLWLLLLLKKDFEGLIDVFPL